MKKQSYLKSWTGSAHPTVLLGKTYAGHVVCKVIPNSPSHYASGVLLDQFGASFATYEWTQLNGGVFQNERTIRITLQVSDSSNLTAACDPAQP